MKQALKSIFLLLLCCQSYVFAQTGSITGKVTSPDNAALPGVNVLVAGTTTGTVTDLDGNYTINASNAASLTFSYIGYITQTVDVNSRSEINLQLVEDATSLSEVVVVGYGTQRKTDVTGSVAALSTKEFAQQPVTRFDQVLQGRVSGVQVTQAGGAPGGDSKVRIRGANSVLGNNDPLYVIDGFVGADYNNINPNDIETIQVLKDAASTSVYGSRGANGVVIITTKNGSKGIRVTYEGQASVSNLIKEFDVLPAAEFAEIVNARASAIGTTAPFSDTEIAGYRENGGTDWQDLVYRIGHGQQHQLTVAGGGDKTTFLISGNYLNQKGIMNNSNFKRYILRSNIATQLNDDLSLHLNLFGSGRINHNTDGGGAITQALAWAPTTPAYGDDGMPTFTDPVGSVYRNPLDYLYDRANDQERTTLNAIGGLKYQLPIDGLAIELQYGVNYLNGQNKILNGQRVSNNNSNASRYSFEQITLQSTNSLSYNRTFNENHNLSAVAVFETQEFTDNNFTANAGGLRFPNQLGYNNIGPNASSTVSAGFQKWTLLSLLGRVNYSFKDKYLLTAAVRRDGSSKFRGDNRYSVFPSLALGWRLSEEQFVKDLNIFSDLKLRGSWGMTGSQAIGPYTTLSAYNTTTPTVAFNNTGVVAGIYQGNPGNPNLKWETTRQVDIGVEMEFLGGRVSVEADYFHKSTNDLLLNAAIPNYAGGGTQTRNIGEIENKGFEFSFAGTPIERGALRWETSLNLSTVKNQVVSLGDLPRLGTGTGVGAGMSTTYEFMLIPGEPLGSYWGLNYLGTFKPDEADIAALQGRFPGDPHYEDVNGDDAITTDDFQIIGRAFPKASGGWNNTVTFKDFTLNVFFQGVFGVDKFNYTRAAALSGAGDARQFILTEIRDYYRPGNENSDIPAFSKTYQPYTQSSRFIENGAYVRLKNISLSYNLPSALLSDVATIRVFVSATNLWTITKYTGPDPESSSVGSGTDTAIGIDYGSYPNAKTYTAGLNITF